MEDNGHSSTHIKPPRHIYIHTHDYCNNDQGDVNIDTHCQSDKELSNFHRKGATAYTWRVYVTDSKRILVQIINITVIPLAELHFWQMNRIRKMSVLRGKCQECGAIYYGWLLVIRTKGFAAMWQYRGYFRRWFGRQSLWYCRHVCRAKEDKRLEITLGISLKRIGQLGNDDLRPYVVTWMSAS